METSNPRLKAAFLEVVENQLEAGDPPETKATLERLMSEGISKEDAKLYIAEAVCVEIWTTIKNQKPFDLERYIRNLRNLPDKPSE